jgi:hypothetical protein
MQGSWVPYALPAVCPDISSAEAQLGQVHATLSMGIGRVISHASLAIRLTN